MSDDCLMLPDRMIDEVNMPQDLQSILLLPMQLDPVEREASFGRWWFDASGGQMVLSIVAAELLDVDAGSQGGLEECFSQVVPDDVLMLMDALATSKTKGVRIDCEIRVINEFDGMRWLRMAELPQSEDMQSIQAGVLINITASKHAAMRERLGFESTQFLVGTHTLGEAITNVIKSVCENLGWEWGAYWAPYSAPKFSNKLSCMFEWHDPAYALAAFSRESLSIQVKPGEGLVGRVWSGGQAIWAEGMANVAECLRSNSVRESCLQSGFAFPVTYLTEDGKRHTTGVMEFFSSLSRQSEAQLPNLSASIGALVAQTVQRIEQTETIRRMAQNDEMTGLANRRHFHHLINLACSEAASSGASFGVLFIDLDRFKPVNDVHGHDAGNHVLQEFARRLTTLTPIGSMVGRLGGDEFAILSQPIASMAQLGALAELVLTAASMPFNFGDVELVVSASIGISVYPENGTDVPGLLRSADAAMYRSKSHGHNGYSFYSRSVPAVGLPQMQELTVEGALHHALQHNEFFLEYQPVFDSFGECLVAVEALIRWRRADGEIVRPDFFIPIAEKSGLIVKIGRWVLKQACTDLAIFHRAGFGGLQVNVNMAASEFVSATVPDELMAIIGAAGIKPHLVCLELTEGMVMQHADKVIPIMQILRKHGFHISLDDFGIGHSSLSRLKQLPISSLKIDRSFVSGLPGNCGDCSIVQTIFDLGRHMKLQVIAEGIETDAQLGFLQQFGYPLMQGFLLGRPMSADTLIATFHPNACASSPADVCRLFPPNN